MQQSALVPGATRETPSRAIARQDFAVAQQCEAEPQDLPGGDPGPPSISYVGDERIVGEDRVGIAVVERTVSALCRLEEVLDGERLQAKVLSTAGKTLDQFLIVKKNGRYSDAYLKQSLEETNFD